MSGVVIPLRRKAVAPKRRAPAPVPVPVAPTGAEVLICEGQEGGWLVYDMSASGNSAGGHGYYDTWAEAVVVARRVAQAIGATFVGGDEGDAV